MPRSGDIQEWLGEAGGGGLDLAIWNACRSLLAQGIAPARWMIVDQEPTFWAVALREYRIDLSRVVMVRVAECGDLWWGVEQGLRSRGVDLVLCRAKRLPVGVMRRWKVAAETGESRCVIWRDLEARGIGFQPVNSGERIHKPEAYATEPSVADLRLRVSPLSSPCWTQRRLRVETLKVRQGLPGDVIEVELDYAKDHLRLVSQLADSADLYSTART